MYKRQALEGAHGIFLRLDRTNNRLWLRSDNNAAWLGGHAPGSGNVIENGLCTIHCDRTTFSGNGSTLTLNISLTLKPLVAGKTLTEWLYVGCFLSTSPSPRDRTRFRLPSSA